MNRIDRLVALMTTLQSRKYVKAEFIASKYEISLRTVYRDLKALGEIGVPIGFENDKGYFIAQGYFLPPLAFSSEEANALVLMASLSEKFADKSIRKNYESALRKIISVLRSPEKNDANDLRESIRVHDDTKSENDVNLISQVQQSMLRKEMIRIKYTDNKGRNTIREVEPIGLTFYSNQWHLVAWCRERSAYRDFKIRMISGIENLHLKFSKTDHLDINEYIQSLK